MDSRPRYTVLKPFAQYIPGDRVILPEVFVPMLLESQHIEPERARPRCPLADSTPRAAHA